MLKQPEYDIISYGLKDDETIDYDDMENIMCFLSMIGKSDVNGQIANCDLFKKVFSNKLKILEIYGK